ncbi:hypothetical protein [Maribellus sediminis]|uniref:hypothetical protein n=1 Tax=Maribellus sediminis TaxID=2696285 RepID=UPI001431046D|nr:hypothetical protein [Maribellus sediminis]
MIKSVLLLIVFLSFQLQSFAGKTDSVANNVFVLIYQENLQEAEQELELQKNDLNDFYYLLLNLDLHWWKYRTTNSKQNTRELEDLLNKLNNEATTSNRQKINRLLTKSYQLRYEKKKLNLVGMLSTRSEMRQLIAEVDLKTLTESGDEQKLLETYITMFQYIEEVNFLSNQINSEERLKQLNRMEEFADDENEMLNTIARFFLARMYQKVENHPETGLKHYKILTEKYPGNSTFAAYKKECERKF